MKGSYIFVSLCLCERISSLSYVEMKGADVLPDLNGNGATVLGERAVDNKRNVYIRDAATGAQFRKVGF